MANRTYLVGLNEHFFDDEDVSLNMLLEAEYCIPLFWLALFQTGDIRLYHNIPILHTSRIQALANIDQRASGLAALLGESGPRLVAQWRAFIEQNDYVNYLLNTAELAQMESGAGEFLAELKHWYAELATITAGPVTNRALKVLIQASPSLADFPYADSPIHLCGHSFELPMPWETENV